MPDGPPPSHRVVHAHVGMGMSQSIALGSAPFKLDAGEPPFRPPPENASQCPVPRALRACEFPYLFAKGWKYRELRGTWDNDLVGPFPRGLGEPRRVANSFSGEQAVRLQVKLDAAAEARALARPSGGANATTLVAAVLAVGAAFVAVERIGVRQLSPALEPAPLRYR